MSSLLMIGLTRGMVLPHTAQSECNLKRPEAPVTTTATAYKSVTLRHGRTRYIEAGTGHPLILLHISSIEGGADDSLPVLDILSSRFRVLAPDLLGWPPS